MALNEPHRGTVADATGLGLPPPGPPPPLSEDVKFKVQQLREIFPDRSERSLRSALARSGGGMEAATEQLLFGDAEEDEDEEDEDEFGGEAEHAEHAEHADMMVLDDDGWETVPEEIAEEKEPIRIRATSWDNDEEGDSASSDEIIDLRTPKKSKVQTIVHGDRAVIALDSESSASSQVEAGSSSSNLADQNNPPDAVPDASASSSNNDASTPPPPAPIPDPVTIDMVLANVHAVFPDCDPNFVAKLYDKHCTTVPKNRLMEMCVADVAETEGRYPRLEVSMGKRKRESEDAAEEEDETKAKDYRKCEPRPELDDLYYAECKQRLLLDFPSTPDAFIRQALLLHNRLYVPTYDHLTKVHADASAAGKGPPYPLLKAPRNDPLATVERGRKKKGKGKAGDTVAEVRAAAPTFASAEMEMEWWWLQKMKVKEQQDKDAELAERMNEEEYEATGNLIECGCCYSDFPFHKCTSCDDGHLFCMDCARRNAEEQIGMRRTELKCFDISGCKFTFPVSEVRRFLPPKLFEGFMRVVQAEELRKAELPDLVSCPFCDYAAIVEDPNDKEFRCGNPDCMVVSCRACQNKTHVPMSCAEHAKENKLSIQHKIEEAMTEALLRECSKCKKKFYKTEGCNKMTCSCGQIMCYVCRIPIKDYNHFTQLPGGGPNPNAKAGCPLFDDSVKRNAEEVVAAAHAATEAERADNPEVDLGDVEEKVKKGIPVNAPAPAAGLAAGPAAGLAAGPAAGPDIMGEMQRRHEAMRVQMQQQQQLMVAQRQRMQADEARRRLANRIMNAGPAGPAVKRQRR